MCCVSQNVSCNHECSINWSHKNSDKGPHLVWMHCSAAVLTVILGQSEDRHKNNTDQSLLCNDPCFTNVSPFFVCFQFNYISHPYACLHVLALYMHFLYLLVQRIATQNLHMSTPNLPSNLLETALTEADTIVSLYCTSQQQFAVRADQPHPLVNRYRSVAWHLW